MSVSNTPRSKDDKIGVTQEKDPGGSPITIEMLVCSTHVGGCAQSVDISNLYIPQIRDVSLFEYT